MSVRFPGRNLLKITEIKINYDNFLLVFICILWNQEFGSFQTMPFLECAESVIIRCRKCHNLVHKKTLETSFFLHSDLFHPCFFGFVSIWKPYAGWYIYSRFFSFFFCDLYSPCYTFKIYFYPQASYILNSTFPAHWDHYHTTRTMYRRHNKKYRHHSQRKNCQKWS